MDVKTPVNTERLTLVLFDADKATGYKNLLRIYNDPFITGKYPGLSMTTHQQIDAKFQSQALDPKICTKADPPGYPTHFAYLKSTGEFVGMVGITQREKGVPAEIGYCIFEQFNGNGYATEAARASLQFWTDVVGIKEIFICASDENPASQRLAQKIGFVRSNPFTFIMPDGSISEHRAFLLPGMAAFAPDFVLHARQS